MIEPEEKIIPEAINLNDEDRQILLSLLHEYTDKLNLICSKIDNSNYYSRIIFFFICCIIFITYIIIQTHGIFLFNFNSIIYWIILIILLGLIIFLIIKESTTEKPLRIQGKTLAIKLERLIRTTSQFQENIEKNYVRKIELDLRLADAESALAYYDMVMKEGILSVFLIRIPGFP